MQHLRIPEDENIPLCRVIIYVFLNPVVVRWFKLIQNQGGLPNCDQGKPHCECEPSLLGVAFVVACVRVLAEHKEHVRGPTGARLKHLADLLNFPRCVHANKIHHCARAPFLPAHAASPALGSVGNGRRSRTSKHMEPFLRSARDKRIVNLGGVGVATRVQ